ncbi:MAG: hypothetical protein GC165_00195 [Armatimonadetes bacterium]|nr:hypothetical protein [Armatimonadota bacterium]
MGISEGERAHQFAESEKPKLKPGGHHFGRAMRTVRGTLGELSNRSISIREAAEAVNVEPGRYYKLECGQVPDQEILNHMCTWCALVPDLVRLLRESYAKEFETDIRVTPFATNPWRTSITGDIRDFPSPDALSEALNRVAELLKHGCVQESFEVLYSIWPTVRRTMRVTRSAVFIAIRLADIARRVGKYSLSSKILRIVESKTISHFDSSEIQLWIAFSDFCETSSNPIDFASECRKYLRDLKIRSNQLASGYYEYHGNIAIGLAIRVLFPLLGPASTKELIYFRRRFARVAAKAAPLMEEKNEETNLCLEASIGDPRRALASLNKRISASPFGYHYQLAKVVALFRLGRVRSAKLMAKRIANQCQLLGDIHIRREAVGLLLQIQALA